MIDEPHIKPVAMTKKQLAQQYNVSVRTLRKWLNPFIEEIGTPQKTYIYTPEQVKKIYEKVGEP
jgi:predicted site-specific integrase-resolvase